MLLEADRAARDAFALVIVQANREPPVEATNPSWPIKLVLAPKNGDASRRFTLVIEARDSQGSQLASLRLRTGFVSKQTRHVTLFIHDACALHRDPSCGSDAACNRWGMEITPSDLGRRAQERRLDATCDTPGQDDLPPDPDETTTETGTAPVAGSGAAGAQAGSGGGAGAAGAAGSGPARPGEPQPDACPSGFERVAGGCNDIDECALGACAEHGECTNVPGSYECACEPGYEQRADACTNIDECQTDNGGCESQCIDREGSVSCACPEPESWLKADGKACASFGAAAKLNLVASAQPTQPRFAFDAQGDGLAVWTQSDGTRASVWTRRYRAAEGWISFARRVPLDDAGDASSARVALDAAGHGAVVWLQTLDGKADVWAATYTGQALGTPLKIDSSDAGSAYDPSLALDDSGNGFAAWTQSDGTHSRVWTNRFRAASGWAGAQTADTASSSEAYGARVVVDAEGNAGLAWTLTTTSDAEGTRSYPWIARYDPTFGRFRTPSLLDAGGVAGLPDLALFEPAGRALAVWTRLDGTRISVWGRRYAPPETNTAIEIASGSSDAFAALPRIALSPSGNGAALWTQGQLTSLSVWANRYDAAADSWSGALQLSAAASTSAPSPSLAVDRNGSGFAIWAELKATSRTLRAERLDAAQGFAGKVELASDTTADPPRNSPAQIAVDPQGNAMAIWDVLDGSQYEVWARKFD
ncbi:MAG TPA: hypothetical protein VJR89_34025 [Polyangiales bacterium]|nr:hypothetical protein [Polyangiales bacterium]